MHKKKLTRILFAVCLLIIGIALFFFRAKTQVLKVKQGAVVESIYGLGKVESNQVYEVKIGVMTNVENIYFKEGEVVQKGDKLISFSGASVFRAPFDGTVTSLEIEQGEVALPQVPLLRLENLSDKYIEVSLEQDAALKVKKNQKAYILFDNLKARKLYGKVKSIYPKEGEFIAHINVENLPENILPGMTADVVIEVGSKSDVILIPVRAISDRRVVRLRDGKKEKVEIELGHTDGVWAEVTQGDIKKTDQLVIKEKK